MIITNKHELKKIKIMEKYHMLEEILDLKLSGMSYENILKYEYKKVNNKIEELREKE